MDTVWFLLLSTVTAFIVKDCLCNTTQPPALTCESIPPPCKANQYCRSASGSAPVCLSCDVSCNGCTGFGNTECKSCKLGYREDAGVCRACPENTFGGNCTGTCHCLLGAADCDIGTGVCANFQCEVGWSGVPECQTPCSNTTFGSGCDKQCHCPLDDVCAPTNGQCQGGQCAVGWSSAGCQNALPQLEAAPILENVTCASVTMVWIGWRSGTDRGNENAVISHYIVYMSYSLGTSDFTPWSVWRNIDYVEGRTEYREMLDNLVPDAIYRFRVDVQQQDGDKPMQHVMAGKVSSEVTIPCTSTTTSTTTTPTTTTTPRPGPNLLDRAQTSARVTAAQTVINVVWNTLPDLAHLNISVTLEYYISYVGDCIPVDNPEMKTIPLDRQGNYNITAVLPWRQYIVMLTAVNIEKNITDTLTLDTIVTPEHVPSGTVQNVRVTAIIQSSCTISWTRLRCAERGGILIDYLVNVTSKDGPMSLTFTTNETSVEVGSLSPYTKYNLTVVYMNAIGSSPKQDIPTAFQTLEGVPNPPTIDSLTSLMTSITVTLIAPAVINGVLIRYDLMYADNAQFSDPSVKPIEPPEESKVIQNLTPDTMYYFKASASTNTGASTYSAVRSISTRPQTALPARPGDVVEDVSARNQTCVKVTWSPPSSINVNITGYNVSYRESGTGEHETVTVTTNQTNAHICDLKSGRYYDFSIVAVNYAGAGAQVELQLSTEQADPPAPNVPEVINTTSSSITVALDPVVIASTAISFGYLVYVQDTTTQGIQKRFVSTSNETCPGVSDLPGNLVRNFTQSEIPTRTVFTLGDGNMYGIYNNTELTNEHEYVIYYVITSYFQDICKYNFVSTAAVKAITIIPPPKTTKAPIYIPQEASDNNTTLIIVIVVIVVLLIIAIIIVLVCCWLRKRQLEQKYKPYFNDNEDFGMKIYKAVDDYDPHRYWNTVYSLRESRYITAGKEYRPNDKHFSNGSAPGMTTAGHPISFHDEFQNLPHGRTAPCTFATKRNNELKNRFSHLLPFDHSRVVLDPDINDNGDYINANFLKGYKHQRAYIAAQSPYNEETVLDFWRMIYQYEVRVIVMMANIVEDNIVKCTQYWPNKGRVMYGKFILDLIDVQEYADYFIRTVKIRTTEDRDWQMVYIFDMSYWPEHGVPEDPIPLLEMRLKVNVYHKGHSSPIVVHCGTGVSRTGVYIAIDSMLDQYEAEDMISVFSFVRKMRKDRTSMVRTVKQYVFIYEAIFEAMVAGPTRVGYNMKDVYQVLARKNPQTGHSQLHNQFKCLQEFTRKLYPAACSSALVPANVNKNRFCEIVPPDMYRPILTTPGGIGRTDYINAVFIDSHRRYNHYIVTQSPLHTTVIDFWKLVYDQDVHTIIMMEPMTYDDDTCAEYWPEDHMKQFEPFFVESMDVYQQENITIRNLKLVCMNSPKDVRHIRQFQFNAWSDSEFVPKSKSMLLDVMDLVKDWQVVNNNEESQILVHCKDGATHSGLYVAISVLCEKFQDEEEVDVFHTVKHLKRRRKQIVDVLDQYRFCYKALWDYINMRMPGGTLTEQMSKTRADRPYNSLSLTSYSSGHDYKEYMPY